MNEIFGVTPNTINYIRPNNKHNKKKPTNLEQGSIDNLPVMLDHRPKLTPKVHSRVPLPNHPLALAVFVFILDLYVILRL